MSLSRLKKTSYGEGPLTIHCNNGYRPTFFWIHFAVTLTNLNPFGSSNEVTDADLAKSTSENSLPVADIAFVNLVSLCRALENRVVVCNSVCNKAWEVCNQICNLELGEVTVTDFDFSEVIVVQIQSQMPTLNVLNLIRNHFAMHGVLSLQPKKAHGFFMLLNFLSWPVWLTAGLFEISRNEHNSVLIVL